MCTIEFDETCDVWKSTRVRARKAYVCDGCGGPIRIGELYWMHRSLFEGMWSKERGCLACECDALTFGKAHGVLLSPSQFTEHLGECLDEEDEDNSKWLPMRDAMRARRATA